MVTEKLTRPSQVEFHPLSPFGAEAKGLNIEATSDRDIDRLKLKLANNGVVVIRHQSVSDSYFVDFLKRLGPLTFTAGEVPVAQYPWLNVVTNVGRTRPPRSVFHTDTSYIAQPPAYTALRAITPPKSGGETLFADQYRAYDTLPGWVRTQLAEAKLLHVVSGLTLDDGDEGQAWHPLFRRHPISGRVALFMSTPERCQAIEGLETVRGQRIIHLLYRHSIRLARLYRHRWQGGDIVIWDNRCTLHRGDHSQVVGNRVLHRGLISGDAPIGIEPA